MQAIRPARLLLSDLLVLVACSSVILVAHVLMGNGYGFHRDEFQFLDDARHLSWGYVAYPPLTAFAGRIAIALLGISPQTFRLPAAMFNAISLVLVGLLARELGGRRPAQVLALLAALPIALAFSSVLQYNTFDYLAWALVSLFIAKLLRTGEPRWWIAVGASVGLGVLSKYSIAFPAISIVAALVLLPAQRHHLRSRWFYFGVLAAMLVASPNLIWLARHHFITLKMEHFIHVRDVRNGRADGYFTDQLKFNLFACPLAVAGLVSLLRSRRFRLLSVLYIGPFLLFALARGRGYYLLPGYIPLFAAGAVALEGVLRRRAPATRIAASGFIAVAFLLNVAAVAWAYLPIAPVRSAMWNWQMKNNGDMGDEIGWQELVAEIASVRNSLPARDRSRLAIFAGNYGEAGALSLYGPAYRLPTPISGVNSFHARGYGPYQPQTVITIGLSSTFLQQHFSDCRFAAHIHNGYGVRNGEIEYGRGIYICHHLRTSWPAFWKDMQWFG